MEKNSDNEQALVWVYEMLDLKEEVFHHSENETRFELLAAHIDNLIQKDFNRLVSILYRVDVPEDKLKKALAANGNRETAGKIIAELLIKRQKEKIAFRAGNHNKI